MQKQPPPNWAIKPLVSEEVYTDRQEFLDYFYQSALKERTRRSGSTVLLGQRRMGKTEIFKRVVNRLFFEQDHLDPEAVVPIYYSFPDHFKNSLDFTLKYVANFIRWYVAFRLRNTEILTTEIFKTHELIETIRDNPIFSKTFKAAFGLLESIIDKDVTITEERAVWLPRRISDYDDTTIVFFLGGCPRMAKSAFFIKLNLYKSIS
jgi:AAA+ ATPase superfamily predicted ATPase